MKKIGTCLKTHYFCSYILFSSLSSKGVSMSLFLITTPRNKQVFIQESELFMWLNDRFTVYPFDHHSLFEVVLYPLF